MFIRSLDMCGGTFSNKFSRFPKQDTVFQSFHKRIAPSSLGANLLHIFSLSLIWTTGGSNAPNKLICTWPIFMMLQSEQLFYNHFTRNRIVKQSVPFSEPIQKSELFFNAPVMLNKHFGSSFSFYSELVLRILEGCILSKLIKTSSKVSRKGNQGSTAKL